MAPDGKENKQPINTFTHRHLRMPQKHHFSIGSGHPMTRNTSSLSLPHFSFPVTISFTFSFSTLLPLVSLFSSSLQQSEKLQWQLVTLVTLCDLPSNWATSLSFALSLPLSPSYSLCDRWVVRVETFAVPSNTQQIYTWQNEPWWHRGIWPQHLSRPCKCQRAEANLIAHHSTSDIKGTQRHKGLHVNHPDECLLDLFWTIMLLFLCVSTLPDTMKFIWMPFVHFKRSSYSRRSDRISSMSCFIATLWLHSE